ncbi:GNAT family N-acetyltransferase [Saccharomonospora azurea]|uniref:GNAT family N-acetyltransferase n=1 Tax=Saccharomonospora azurea TaxID=40988 RepID=UPI000564AEF2|nr:GNAT family N-acetyltransferase [Saccharomonospora azurea]
MSEQEQPVILVEVDEPVLARLVRAATTDAAADDVTPPLTADSGWTPARVEWLRRFHRDRRAGLGGPAGESTWGVVTADGVVGSVRLKRTAEGVLETGVWLTRMARGRGLGTAAMAVAVRKAVELGAREVRADTTVANVGALRLLRRLGFTLARADGGAVHGLLRL